jgi:hydrogenase-4 component E
MDRGGGHVNDALVAAILVLGLAVVVVRRRSVAIALVAAQSAALGAGALDLASERSGEFLVASLVLVTKAVVVPALLFAALRRTREPRLVTPAIPALTRLVVAAAVALVAAVLVPPLGIGDEQVEQTSVALVLVGIAVVVLRRPALLQVTGLVVAENGVALLAIAAPGGLSYVVELGALFDLVLVVTVASAFAQRIYTEFGSGDTELLRGLHD